MDNLCKQYIKNAKALFPVMGKAERKYFENLELNVQEYCEETSVSSLEDLYKNFGTPAEVVNSYFTSANMDYVLKQIKRAKVVKTTLIAFVVAALIAMTTCCTILYSAYQVFQDEQMFSEETVIE